MRITHTSIIAAVASVFFSLAYAQDNSHFEVVSTSAMPLKAPPGETEKITPSISAVTTEGVSQIKDSTKYAEFRRILDIAQGSADEKPDTTQRVTRPPSATRDISTLQIAFMPRRLGIGQQLWVASPAGMLTNTGWSGVERFISVPNVGKYRLMELDLTKSGGKFFLSSDAVNTNIENSPAGTKVFVDDDGNIVEEVVWVSEGKFHMLTYLPETVASAIPGRKQKMAVAAFAISMAHTLMK
jgi:hypothetical protein